LWSRRGNNAADKRKARFFGIDDPQIEYLERKPVVTEIDDELGLREKDDEQVQAHLSNCGGVHV